MSARSDVAVRRWHSGASLRLVGQREEQRLLAALALPLRHADQRGPAKMIVDVHAVHRRAAHARSVYEHLDQLA